MTTYYRDGILTFPFFSKFPELLVFMSTRKLGNLNVGSVPNVKIGNFLNSYQINWNQFIAMEQIHAAEIEDVNKKQGGSIIGGVDGLITSQKNLFLGVKTADCVPLFFYAPQKHILGTVHAGWKGTLKKISQKMIRAFLRFGAEVNDIHVLIGPHIHGCCYFVDKTRADIFSQTFKQTDIVIKKNRKYFLDLGLANYYSLLDIGVSKNQIGITRDCTSCLNQIYFSYRKDQKGNTGTVLGIIGLKYQN